MDIEWEDPPESTRNKAAKTDAIVAELKKRPGEWALVEREAIQSRGNKYASRGCEVTVRATGKYSRLFNIYVRWPAR